MRAGLWGQDDKHWSGRTSVGNWRFCLPGGAVRSPSEGSPCLCCVRYENEKLVESEVCLEGKAGFGFLPKLRLGEDLGKVGDGENIVPHTTHLGMSTAFFFSL